MGKHFGREWYGEAPGMAGERAGSSVLNMVDKWMSCGYGRPMLSEEYDPEMSTMTFPFPADSADGVSEKSAENVGRRATGQTIKNESENEDVAYLPDLISSVASDFNTPTNASARARSTDTGQPHPTDQAATLYQQARQGH